MRMFLWHKPLADCKHCSPEIVLPFPPRGGARVISFFLLLCNKKSGTISACRSKKAAQRFCWTASVPSSAHLYHTTSFRQNQHNFVQICPHLSKFVQPALKSTAPASKFPSHQEAIRFVQRSFSCCSLGYVLIQILWFSSSPDRNFDLFAAESYAVFINRLDPSGGQFRFVFLVVYLLQCGFWQHFQLLITAIFLRF